MGISDGEGTLNYDEVLSNWNDLKGFPNPR